jgi:Methylase involved in ubiquinone/menaquinone biosynthesis
VVKLSETFYTIGEFAEKAGVTQRTLRFYDRIGLLKPSSYSSSGHRLYSRNDFPKLQKILTLKFIGLSLEDIAGVMKLDSNDRNFKKSLEIQRDIMDKKMHHMKAVMEAIGEALDMLDNQSVLNWDKFVNIINVLNMEKNWMEQYQNASNLKDRIKVHELYSTNKYGWMRWYFEQLQIPAESRVLELGCGDASLWVKNIDRIPPQWEVTLTDFSQGMLKDAMKALGNNKKRFNFLKADAQCLPFEDCSFDVVIANHMLYHVPDIDRAFSEIYRVLENNGLFYASTVGKNHMAQMREIADRFGSDSITIKSWDYTEKFQLENGMDIVSRWFKDVKLKRYEDNLVITDAAALVDYILSMPGNGREAIEEGKIKELTDFLKMEIQKSKGIFIKKDTGFFEGRKYE